MVPRAENLTDEQKAWLDELESQPIPEPVETSQHMQDKVASEQAVNDATSTRLGNKAKAAAAAEKARDE